MTIVTCCIIVADEKKAAVIEAVAHLTPEYTMDFIRKIAPAGPAPTWETSPTHWRNNDNLDQAKPALWQSVAVNHVLPEDFVMPEEPTMSEQEIIDAMDGLRVYTGVNVGNPNDWAAAHMSPLGLVDVPEPPL